MPSSGRWCHTNLKAVDLSVLNHNYRAKLINPMVNELHKVWQDAPPKGYSSVIEGRDQMAKASKSTQASETRRMRGFEPAIGFMQRDLRTVSETRGFAVTRLLTHWAEIVGPDLASMTKPLKISYNREGMGATLMLLTRSATAPQVQMLLPSLQEKVNAVYGYKAIARITLTQTAPVGFSEGQAEFTTPLKAKVLPPDPMVVAKATEVANGVQNESLRSALEAMAQNVLSQSK
jgi:hypothetical protein